MYSLTIQQNKERTEASTLKRLSLLLPGCLLLLGFWGMAVQELLLGIQWLVVLVPAIAALAVGLMLRWEKKWQSLAVIGTLMLTCMVGILFSGSISSGIAGLMEKVSHWRFLRTGNYTPGYETAGDVTAVLLLGAVCSGFFTAWLLRMKRPIFQIILTVTVLVLWMIGLLQWGWWLAIYLLGTLLMLAAFASGQGKALTFSGTVAFVLAAAITGTTLLSGAVPVKTELGTQLSRGFHRLRWENARNPMPEGVLENLGAYDPTDEPALKVTMQHWIPLYLRGFVAGNYTDTGWQSLDPTRLSGNADTLYALQADHFFAADQTAAAWQSVDVSGDNAIAVRVQGACRSTAYLPYGAGSVSEGVLSASDLRWEGLHTPTAAEYSAQLYSIELSYLLQAQLKDTDTSYRLAESAYRDWVYAQYLTVPEDAQQVLTKHFSVNGEMTTVQAKREIAQLLPELIEYNENVLTSSGERDFLSYVLEVSKSGYSVHYATLATLLLRCCGIPARYVEGYVISPSQAEALTDGESLTLTQRNAHAWTEYYLNGVGWVPFDATPGYSDILVYELPTDGLPTQESGTGIQHQEQEEQPDPPVKKPQAEEEKTKESQHKYIRQAISFVLLFLLLALVLLLLRTVLLRHRLRKQQQIFHSGDHRRACAGILCYIQVLTKAIESPNGNLTVSDLAERIAALLDHKITAGELETLMNEVWYSSHRITQEQQEAALSWLQLAMAAWKQKVSPFKRFKQRFISCTIL